MVVGWRIIVGVPGVIATVVALWQVLAIPTQADIAQLKRDDEIRARALRQETADRIAMDVKIIRGMLQITLCLHDEGCRLTASQVAGMEKMLKSIEQKDIDSIIGPR